MLRLIAKIMQQTGFVGEVDGEKTFPHLFISPQGVGYKPGLRFGQEQIGGASQRFECIQNFGLYRANAEKKIRIAILNAAPESQLDYLRTVFRDIPQPIHVKTYPRMTNVVRSGAPVPFWL